MAGVIRASIQDLDTPLLLLDKLAFQRNIRRMADYFCDRPCQLRPHFKNHKCTRIAQQQLEAGSAVGITCAKLSEAEALADAGIEDVLVANQIVGKRKMDRLVQLAQRIKIRVAVDHASQILALSEAATGANVMVGLLVEIDVGMGRCGVASGQQARKLAQQTVDAPGVRFDGLQAYEGHVVNVVDPNERRHRAVEAMQQALDARKLIESAGIPVRVISGGSSSTYAITGTLEGIDELQAGTYATMDWTYQRLVPEFEQALSVLCRVISRPKSDVAVLDVGVKGVGHEFGPPRVQGYPEAEIPQFLSEEHCIVHHAPAWPIGQAVELIPSHACTTSNLYRQFHVHEEGRIVDIWPIEASGQPS